MNLLSSKHRKRALTQFEVMVVIVVSLILVVCVAMPFLAAMHNRSSRISCFTNLKQIELSFRIWEGDHNNEYPTLISVTNGGAKELIEHGDVAGCLLVKSNLLVTPKNLICPMDKEHFPATDFGTHFNNSHISYFINADADETYPQEVMSGDDNLAVNGVPVKPGLVDSALPLQWTAARHNHIGYLGYVDGSVAVLSNNGLEQSLALGTNGVPTVNRFAIP